MIKWARAIKFYICDGCKNPINKKEMYVRVIDSIYVLKHKKYCKTCYEKSYLDEDNNKLIKKQTRYDFIRKENKNE